MKSYLVASLAALSIGMYGIPRIDGLPTVAHDNQGATTTTLQLTGADHRPEALNAQISQQVDLASAYLESALDKAPAVAMGMARSIQQHGVIRAILYDDPQVTGPSNEMAADLGKGLRALGDAVAMDMVHGANANRDQAK